MPVSSEPLVGLQASQLTSRKTVAFMCFLGFFASLDYAISRSQIESLYNIVWQVRPELLWLVTAVVLFGVVSIYNYFTVRKNLWYIFCITILISSGLLFVLAWALPTINPLQKQFSVFEKTIVFLLALWKDVYIVIIIEIFWTFANVVNKVQTARSWYGVFAFIGSFGDFVGNVFAKYLDGKLLTKTTAKNPLSFIESFLSHHLPSPKIFSFLGMYPSIWLVLPCLLITGVFAFCLHRFVGPYQVALRDPKDRPSFVEGLKVASESKYLLYILVTIGLFQIVTGFVQKQQDLVLQQNPVTQNALRNTIYIWVSIGSIGLGFINSFLFRFIKVEWPLFGIPLVIGGFILGFSIHPAFWLIGGAYIASKTFNYSIFRSAKELLYVPLSYIEKVQGKGLIDIFIYRFGKAFAGLLLLPIQYLHANQFLGWFSISLVVVWIVITIPLVKEYYQRVLSKVIQEKKASQKTK